MLNKVIEELENISEDGNRILAFSNLMGLFPLFVAWSVMRDTITFLCLLNVTLASFVSHLFECHKHGMPGYGLTPRTSYLLNRWDVVGCLIFMVRFAQLYIQDYGWSPYFLLYNYNWLYLVEALIGFVFLRISEYDKYNPDRKHIYVPCHMLWHFIIFYVIGLYMLDLF